MIVMNKDEIIDKHYGFCLKYLKNNIHQTIKAIADKNKKREILLLFSDENLKKLVCSKEIDKEFINSLKCQIDQVDGEFVKLSRKVRPKKSGDETQKDTFKNVMESHFLSAYELFSSKDDKTIYCSEKYGN